MLLLLYVWNYRDARGFQSTIYVIRVMQIILITLLCMPFTLKINFFYFNDNQQYSLRRDTNHIKFKEQELRRRPHFFYSCWKERQQKRVDFVNYSCSIIDLYPPWYGPIKKVISFNGRMSVEFPSKELYAFSCCEFCNNNSPHPQSPIVCLKNIARYTSNSSHSQIHCTIEAKTKVGVL
jgi:hypothetical protein